MAEGKCEECGRTRAEHWVCMDFCTAYKGPSRPAPTDPPSGEDAGMVEAAVSADIERAAIEAFGRSDLFMSDTVGYQKSHVIKLMAQFAAAQTASLAARVEELATERERLLELEKLAGDVYVGRHDQYAMEDNAHLQHAMRVRRLGLCLGEQPYREYKARQAALAAADSGVQGCHSDRDGDCTWGGCPQLRDGEPKATGRHCPLDADSGEGEK